LFDLRFVFRHWGVLFVVDNFTLLQIGNFVLKIDFQYFPQQSATIQSFQTKFKQYQQVLILI
jgi:hypothetical protein